MESHANKIAFHSASEAVPTYPAAAGDLYTYWDGLNVHQYCYTGRKWVKVLTEYSDEYEGD